MSLRFCASGNKHVFLSRNGTLVRPSGFATSWAGLQRNPTDTLQNFKAHSNRDCEFETKTKGRRRVIAANNSSAASTDAVTAGGNNCLSTSGWLDFARNVSGEWDGYGADFSNEGKPIELPESIVPEAFREWEVKVFDWQTQCPTLASPEDYSLYYKSIKLLPTVGCEGDAATQYSVDERCVGGSKSIASAFAYQSTGCYVAIWLLEDHAARRTLELEHCLIDPRSQESRVRIIQALCAEPDQKLILQHIKIFCEQWYGPFSNGDQLGGCAIRDSAFASMEPLKSSEISGAWQGLHAIASFQNSQTNIFHELLDHHVLTAVRDERDLVLLPKQLWCSLKESEGEICFEAGWLLGRGHAITSKCRFSANADLKEIAIACETALSQSQ